MHRGITQPFLPALILCCLCLGCARQDDHDRIGALIAKGAAAAEAHDIAAMLDLATDGVRAMPMDLDRQGIKAALWRAFKHYGPLKVLYPRPVVDLNEATDAASTIFPFLIVKREGPLPGLQELRDDPGAWLDAIGDTTDLYRLRLLLIKQDGEWLVEHASLERFTGVGFD